MPINLKSKPLSKKEKLKLNALYCAYSIWAEAINLKSKGYTKEEILLAFDLIEKEYKVELYK